MNNDRTNGGQDDIKPYKAESIRDAQKKKSRGDGTEAGTNEPEENKDGTENGEARDDTDTSDNDAQENTENSSKAACKTWLEVLPSKGGILLIALLAEIMTEGLTPTQMSLLGAFIVSVGDLISYKAARDGLDC
jgi:hypothetical protein